ncbi:MAG: LPS export ABC transporter periplasmic protein LptC [Sphingomonas sp.]
MSDQADSARRTLQRWAKAGGSHDRTVRLLQLALPALTGALAAVMLFAPFSNRGELSFLLAKNDIAVTPQRLRVDSAVYRGRDNRGRPFEVSAGEAIQRSAADPIVRVSNMAARIDLADGPARISADAADYDPASDRIRVPGPVSLTTSDGFRLSVSNVDVDLRQRRMSSDNPVTGRLPIGSFSANSIRANIDTRQVSLRGNVRTRLNAR